ncbi:hypothetical protein M3936_03755 [Sutcliffiella horikoshii]|uniref:hypothetical protein n=1 Tax=Sutcliffiella horikoshii TaxID=79883 RepID=UPI00203DC984|nr:hypothetical protein [Sutcliffiella horikoshii]MCM3616692.1 hypothetical protein [Sutcliffiella horikoshii]
MNNELQYKVLENTKRNIADGKGFYKSVLNNKEFLALDEEEQNMICAVLMTDMGWSFKELIDMCIEEQKPLIEIKVDGEKIAEHVLRS